MAKSLRAQYLVAYKDAKRKPTNPTRVAEQAETNVNHARQILNDMVKGGLLVETERDGELGWIHGHDVDSHSFNKFAETLVEAPIVEVGTVEETTDENGEAKPARRRTASKSAAAPHGCLCGCEAQIPGKSNYKPGHDARHAGQVARAMAESSQDQWPHLLSPLPSEALRAKASDMASRLIAKANAKATKQATKVAAQEPVWTDIDPIKVGRYEMPAQKNQKGEIRRNSKRDGSGEWVAVEAKSAA